MVTPDGYDPDETYPAVVLLHGYGANMSDLASLCPAIERERYIYVCPNAPIPVQIGPGKIGYAWTPPGPERTPEDVEKTEDKLNAFFEEIVEGLPVDEDRMVLGGFSQGGMMTYALGLTNPGVFRGLVALSSRLDDPEDLSGRFPTDRDQPILVAHGTEDSMISIDDARRTVRFLEDEGYQPVYNEYAMGHEINQDVLNDVVPWIETLLL
jgi:phospholipase/carboxylesterase